MTIRSVGMAVPDKVMTNADFAQYLDTSDEWIRTRSGIRERRICSDEENTLTLALRASQDALAKAKLTPEDIDLIVVATSTPYAPLPATACFLQAELGCREVGAFDLAAACSGFVYAMVNATGLLNTGQYRHILVVGAEVMSRFMDFQDRGTCVLLGDAAGAAIISPPDNEASGLYHHCLGARGSGARLIWIPSGGSLEPASQQTIEQRNHYLKMRGREVYRFAVTQMQKVIEDSMNQVGLSADDVAMVIPHQSNARIIESARDKLGLPKEKVAMNIDRYGNTSAASIPLALAEAMADGKLKTGDWVILAGFGAGLTWGSAVIRL